MKKYLFIVLFLCINSVFVKAKEETRYSGNPIPRFASLKSGSINTRFGPAVTYPIQYIYKSQFQPVKVINEYYGWYQIQDINGDTSWVHKNYLSITKYAIPSENNTHLYLKDSTNTSIIANIDKGVILKVENCDDDFCYIETLNKDYKGYIQKSKPWGV